MKNKDVIKEMKRIGIDFKPIVQGEYLVIKTEDLYKIYRELVEEAE